MGVLKGSISYAKFHVHGELPDDFREKAVESVLLRKFTPLTPDDDAEQRVGWCPTERPLEPEVDFHFDDLFVGAYLNVTLRIDAWKFPGAVFKAAFAEAEKKALQKNGREKLT